MSTETAPARPSDPVAERLPAPSVLLLGVLLVGAFVVILNETAMNVALTRIMHDLQVAERTAQWLTTGFMLTMAVVIPTTGWLLRRTTTRQAFVLAMSLFSLGTLVSAVAFGFGMLLTGRIIQATGTAVMMPLMMTTVMQVVPPSLHGRVMGTISLVMSTAPAIGPTVSGLILQFLPWRFVFVIVLPIALAILVLGIRLMPAGGERTPAHLDLLSIPLAGLGFGGLVYGLSQIGSQVPGWQVATILGLGIAALLGFGARQLFLQRQDNALLDLRIFTIPVFSAGITVMGIVMMALFGSIIATPLVLQELLGMDPLAVGLLLLPGGLLMGLLGPVVGRLYDLVGPRWLVVPGALVVAGSFAIYATISTTTTWVLVLIANLLMSLGLAFMMTPLFTVSLGSLPPSLVSYGSATIGTVQQVAGAAGTAMFITVMSSISSAQASLGEAAAMAAGARGGFLTMAAVWLIAIAMAFRLPRRAPETAGQTTVGH